MLPLYAENVSVPIPVPAKVTAPVAVVVAGWMAVALMELYAQVSVCSVAVPWVADRGTSRIPPTPGSLSWRSVLSWAVDAVVPTGPKATWGI